MLVKGDSIGLIACSNARPSRYEEKIKNVEGFITALGINIVRADTLLETDEKTTSAPQARALELHKLYDNEKIKLIFDISGGDLANQILPFLDFERITAANKPFVGLSDLTTVLNAVLQQTNQKNYYFQLMTLAGTKAVEQQNFFKEYFVEGHETIIETRGLTDFKEIVGKMYGGNIRCLLKLAGTSFWPEFKGNIILLEGFSGSYERNASYIAQLQQLGVFTDCIGIVLGTFTELDQKNTTLIESLILAAVPDDLPVARTSEVGHGDDGKAIILGHTITIRG